MIYTIYNPTTGEILYNFTCTDPATANMNLKDSSFIEGSYSSETHYIENNQPASMGDRPSVNHMFDYTTKTWQLDQSKAQESIRNIRKQLLSTVDQINPIWYGSLTAEQQQELIAYRQALLDVPQQSSFPESVEWPAKPTWL